MPASVRCPSCGATFTMAFQPLNSWKDIATYVGRGVRTVQRWESHFGLPVHRPKGKDRSAVLAFPEEISEWLHRTPNRSDQLTARRAV